MGLRDSLNQHPKTSLVVVGVFVAVVVVFFVSSLRPETVERESKAFYSIDDGKTWFVDDLDRVPPFDRDGKIAVRAKVFVCPGDGKQFVGYLERFSAVYKKRLDESATDVKAGKPPKLLTSSQEVVTGGTEVKKPGEANWTPASDLIAKSKVTRISCPSGEAVDSVRP